MNSYEAEKIVTCALIKQGAFCRSENITDGLNNIIATWKSTMWRILVRVVKTDVKSSWPSDEEIMMLHNKSAGNNQTIVLAFVHSNSSIEYRAIEDGRIIRPRCIIKVNKANSLVKAYNHLN